MHTSRHECAFLTIFTLRAFNRGGCVGTIIAPKDKQSDSTVEHAVDLGTLGIAEEARSLCTKIQVGTEYEEELNSSQVENTIPQCKSED